MVWIYMFATLFMTLPSLVMRFQKIHLSPQWDAVLFGLGILGAAFLLSWAAEIAQMDVSRGLALAILALIAILPEYAVDLYFAWVAAVKPEYAHYATANMTGANRLLVGAGWPFIVLLFFLRFRKYAVALTATNRAEIAYLILATIYAFSIPLKGTLNLIDSVFLILIFAAYAWRTAVMEVEEPDLVGPAQLIARLPKGRRRLANLFLFAYAGVAIFVSAEPFAESLIDTGKVMRIDEFILVQWVAPIASEAPEFIIAAIWTVRGQAVAAIGALISSKVNQWTLLVGTIPLVYNLSLGKVAEMVLDTRQNHEILLTAAQSIFATVVLLNLQIGLLEAAFLFVLFFVQMVIPEIRVEVSILYLVLASFLLIPRRKDIVLAVREGIFNNRKGR